MPLAHHVPHPHAWLKYTPAPARAFHAFWQDENGRLDDVSICGRAPESGCCAVPSVPSPPERDRCEFCIIVLR